jgi:glyoxylate/hydroxypyruvate reductase
MAKPKLLMVVPGKWAGLADARTDNADIVLEGRDVYRPDEIDYAVVFVPPRGLIASLPNLKAAFCLGAGVDGVLSDPAYPKHVPLVRFVDQTLSAEMAQYVLMHVLIRHRMQRSFDEAQREGVWKQKVLERPTEKTRVGFLGLGEIGAFAARRVAELNFQVSSWTRSRKAIAGIKSFAGDEELIAFLGQTDILVCLLSLTRQTKGILNAKTFVALPKDAFVINAARGAHLIEKDLLAAINCGHLSGAALDVFDAEPLPPQSPLWRHPKVTVTPHVAAISQPEVVVRYVLDGIAKFERGETPDNIVDVETAY